MSDTFCPDSITADHRVKQAKFWILIHQKDDHDRWNGHSRESRRRGARWRGAALQEGQCPGYRDWDSVHLCIGIWAHKKMFRYWALHVDALYWCQVFSPFARSQMYFVVISAKCPTLTLCSKHRILHSMLVRDKRALMRDTVCNMASFITTFTTTYSH